MAFPTSLPSYTITAGAETANGAGGGTGLSGLLNAFEVDITALGSKVGTGASTPTSGQFLRSNGTGTSAWDTVANAAVAIGALLYPVGSYYINETVSTNPATLLGFGTWTAVAGRFIIGVGTSDAVYGAGVSGGESNHLLTGAESGTSVHTHGVTDPTHTHGYASDRGGVGYAGGAANAKDSSLGSSGSTTASASTGLTVNNSSAANASSAHNNLPPYQTAYIWKRTA